MSKTKAESASETQFSDFAHNPGDIYLPRAGSGYQLSPDREIHAPGLAGQIEKYPELTLEQVRKAFPTMKKDDANVKIVYLAGVSAFAPDKDQLNVAFNSPSCTGKSYIVLEVMKVFPEEDCLSLWSCNAHGPLV